MVGLRRNSLPGLNLNVLWCVCLVWKILFLPSCSGWCPVIPLYPQPMYSEAKRRAACSEKRVSPSLKPSGHSAGEIWTHSGCPLPAPEQPLPAPGVLARLLSLILTLRSRFIIMNIGSHLPCFPVSGQWMGQNFYSSTTPHHPHHLHLIFGAALSCPIVWFCLGYL